MKANGGVQLLLAAVSALAISSANAAWVDVYSNDFNAGASPQITGAGNLQAVQGYAGIGTVGNQFSGQYLVNSTGCAFGCGGPLNPAQSPSPTVLTLNNLPAHSAIQISFLLAIRDSWDGSYYAPTPQTNFANHDYFNVAIDGVAYFSETFSFRLNDPQYIFSYVAPVGGLLTPGALLNRDENTSYPDLAYDMGLDSRFQSIAHSGSSLTLSFFASGAGWQGGTDESWGIDNLRVSVLTLPDPQPVPEPETWLMVLAGLGVLARIRRA
jgi:hypothetical protein